MEKRTYSVDEAGRLLGLGLARVLVRLLGDAGEGSGHPHSGNHHRELLRVCHNQSLPFLPITFPYRHQP